MVRNRVEQLEDGKVPIKGVLHWTSGSAVVQGCVFIIRAGGEVPPHDFFALDSARLPHHGDVIVRGDETAL